MERISKGEDIAVRIVKRLSARNGNIGLNIIMYEHSYSRDIENTYFTIEYKVHRYNEHYCDLIDEFERRFYNREIAEDIYRNLVNIWM